MTLSVRDLGFGYPGAERAALEGVTFSVPAGGLLCLCGVNGSGKSSLLSLLAGVQRPSAGGIRLGGGSDAGPGDRLDGKDGGKATAAPAARQARETARVLRHGAALLLQDADMQILGATVGEDLCLALDPGDAEAHGAARDMADRFGLGHQWDEPVHTLSYGQKRKLCLAAALLTGPHLLLLDEPFSGLDHPAIMELRAVLVAHRAAGLTQVVSVHDLEPVVDVADAMLVLHEGRQVLYGPPCEVLDHVRDFGIRPPYSWTAHRTIVPYL
ncbi:ATP-binding cassette domain-containing protein [Nitratidesulfovibrio vulgaris]|uniref:ABC transporter related protein n=1 Tax=Nitratidesulfovibrio vulgaris (strain DP4) TaxID=391774 RepID=A0A0H3A7N8_NITV4|nr:ATP-binding cassette domain-containing protein [Nitratidesulfovibrio vulgaris]ABM27500.1 ABC transporter related protein [Nitratidesulfovibrio vulgaris DP4]GEB79564.1 ABC transporter [Desulfovibrio desulfuricans]